MLIVVLSVAGIIIEEAASDEKFPVNPTIVRFMRVLRIARGYLHFAKIYLLNVVLLVQI